LQQDNNNNNNKKAVRSQGNRAMPHVISLRKIKLLRWLECAWCAQIQSSRTTILRATLKIVHCACAEMPTFPLPVSR